MSPNRPIETFSYMSPRVSMGASMAAPEDHCEEDAGEMMSPERRLDAIADIFARGLARLVLAKASHRRDATDAPSQVPGMSSESTLIDAPRRAVMVAGAGRLGASKGGRSG
jgi:hypothetical protein